jgi:membrane-associated protease RseP (regulator of RpoE activity)
LEPSEPPQPTTETFQYEQVYKIVAAEFSVEEGFIEYDAPTFYVTPKPNSKQAFLRLYKQLDSKQLVPILREKEKRVMLQVVPKPPVKPSRSWINIVLLLATIGTTLITGYLLSLSSTELMPELMPNPWIGAVMFSAAVMFILGAHEMGHKLTANRHKIEATYPYFIPGLPPLGTFGAVIQEKSLPPTKDSFFDLGISGPMIGFLATIIVTLIGVQLSVLLSMSELPSGVQVEPLQELFGIPLPFLFGVLLILFPPAGSGTIIWLHPVVQAGYIGMIVTMLNLMPVGQLDGGHIAHVLLGEKTRLVLSLIAIIVLFFAGYYFMAIFAVLIARVKHPDPLDGISELSQSRKLATVLAIAVFVLSFVPLQQFF